MRVVYYWMPAAKRLWLFAIYAKGDVDDLTIDERHALKKAIDLELKAMRKNV